jgi:starch-binding outer membrane protein, SusD/RagB family
MKKLIYLLFILLAVVLNSCKEDFMDVYPKDKPSDATFWKTESDATMGLTACYHLWEGFTNICMFDCASDNAYDKGNFGYAILGNGNLTPNTYIMNVDWLDGYSRTNSCSWPLYTQIWKYNNFLANIDKVDMDATKKAQYKAEVRFLRAYDYFWKTMLHGDMPLITEPVPFDYVSKRDPAATIKAFILSELDAIGPDLPVQNNLDSKGHVTRGAAHALRARLNLLMGNYADAMTDAKAVIDMTCYELYPNYEDMFLEKSEGDNKEAILSVQYIKDQYISACNRMNACPTENGWSACTAVKSMVDAYECSNGKTIDDPTSGYDIDHPFANRDPRLNMSILLPGTKWKGGRHYNSLDQYLPGTTVLNPDYHLGSTSARSGYNIKKYIDTTDIYMGAWPPNGGQDIMVFRLAEMYLTYAEAVFESNSAANFDQALGYINAIRARAGQIAATTLTRDLIRRERRVELAFEGLRYFDVERWDLGPTVLTGDLYGCRQGTLDVLGNVTWVGDGNVVNSTNYILIESRNYRPATNYLFPIPQSILNVNPGWGQNDGY